MLVTLPSNGPQDAGVVPSRRPVAKAGDSPLGRRAGAASSSSTRQPHAAAAPRRPAARVARLRCSKSPAARWKWRHARRTPDSLDLRTASLFRRFRRREK